MNYTIGKEIKPFEVEINKYLPYYYAGASLDFNLIHIDDEFAKKVGLGGIILQGLCTMAYVLRAVMSKDLDPCKLKKIKVRFRQVVKPLDRLTVQGKVSGINNDLVTIDLLATNQKGEQVITNGQATIIEN